MLAAADAVTAHSLKGALESALRTCYSDRRIRVESAMFQSIEAVSIIGSRIAPQKGRDPKCLLP